MDARELSPGEWTDKTLDDAFHLDELIRTDAIGERYRGTALEADEVVTVTIFNRAAVPDPERLQSAQDLLDTLSQGEAPRSVLGLRTTALDREEAPYVVEDPSAPRTLREHLDSAGTLEWRETVGLIARVARTVDWMADRGHVHRGLHPGAIFFEQLDPVGGVQVGDWLQSMLTSSDQPLEDASETASFYGFAPYLAPEVIRDGAARDARSLVYTLGMMLYESILGTPPFYSNDPTDTLKRHLHEKPLKLSIAAESEQLHAELDDVLEMMWAKDPSDRFQSPGATIPALASLVGAGPDALAPQLASQSTEDASPPSEKESDKTLMGMGRPHPDDVDAEEGDPSEEESSEADATTSGVQIPSPQEVEAGSSSEVRTGEAAIGSGAGNAQGSSEIPSIIIEDPEIESAMGSEDSDDELDENRQAEADQSFSTWSDTLESAAETPGDEAVVTGYVDAKEGVQHNPDGGSVPVSVRAEDITSEEDAGSRAADSEPDPAATLQQQVDEAEISEEKTAEMDVEEQIEKAKAQLREEGRTDESAQPSEATDAQSTTRAETDEEAVLLDDPAREEAEAALDEVERAGTDEKEAETSTNRDEANPESDEVAVSGEATVNDNESDLSQEEIERIQSDDVVILDEESSSSEEKESNPPAMPNSSEDASADETDAAAPEGEEEAESSSSTASPRKTDDPPDHEPPPEAREAQSAGSEEADGDASNAAESPTSPVDQNPSPGSADADRDLEEPNPGEIFDADGNVTTDASDEWFQVTDEEAWMAADVREGRDRSEVFRRYITWGVVIALVTVALGLVLFSQVYNPDAAKDSAETKQEQTAEE